ncbi:MAG: hypothetical protein KJ630_00955 [Proteobacteria bacterium]|nr:hypothetical protein [Pseudomonadota bacterium]
MQKSQRDTALYEGVANAFSFLSRPDPAAGLVGLIHKVVVKVAVMW